MPKKEKLPDWLNRMFTSHPLAKFLDITAPLVYSPTVRKYRDAILQRGYLRGPRAKGPVTKRQPGYRPKR